MFKEIELASNKPADPSVRVLLQKVDVMHVDLVPRNGSVLGDVVLVLFGEDLLAVRAAHLGQEQVLQVTTWRVGHRLIRFPQSMLLDL